MKFVQNCLALSSMIATTGLFGRKTKHFNLRLAEQEAVHASNQLRLFVENYNH